MRISLIAALISLATAAPCTLNAAMPHMYYAYPYQFLTRYERKGLFTLDGWAIHGNSSTGYNGQSQKTNVLNIYGPEQLQQVGKNVPTTPFSAIDGAILGALWRHVTPNDDSNYATVVFNGKCAYTGGGFTAGFNITDEFFVMGSLPFYRLAINNPTYTDTTPVAQQDAEWDQFYAAFNDIVADAGLNIGGYSQAGVGDITFCLGWTRSTEELETVEYLDATFMLGALIGTAAAKNEDYAFSFAPGYDKHSGVFFSLALQCGLSEHVSFGLNIGELFLFKRTKDMRIQSAAGQNGFIKLVKTPVTRELGNLYDVGGNFKFEWNVAAFSIGYGYIHQGTATLVAQNAELYPGDVINNDSMLQNWSMHVLSFGFELDFANNESRKIHPKLSVAYNRILRGRRVFDNNTVSGTLGISVTFDF